METAGAACFCVLAGCTLACDALTVAGRALLRKAFIASPSALRTEVTTEFARAFYFTRPISLQSDVTMLASLILLRERYD